MNILKPIVFVFSNALDEKTRNERDIKTDSPAASRKIFMLCEKLKANGITPYILSLGRGKANNTGTYYPSKVVKKNGVIIIYAPFYNRYFFSEVISLFYFVLILPRFFNYKIKSAVFYNRMPAYILNLFICYIAKFRVFLDLEDGEVLGSKGVMKKFIISLNVKMFDTLCKSGALLACNALKRYTRISNTLSYYGVIGKSQEVRSFVKKQRVFLVSGTLEKDTGMDLLFDSINILNLTKPKWASNVVINVTGQGNYLDKLKSLSAEENFINVNVHGRLSHQEYRKVITESEVGLALKPVQGDLSDTTFPSKVVEFSSAGLLVLSTNISDVKHLFEDGAIYLNTNEPSELIKKMEYICTKPDISRFVAKQGQINIASKLDFEKICKLFN